MPNIHFLKPVNFDNLEEKGLQKNNIRAVSLFLPDFLKICGVLKASVNQNKQEKLADQTLVGQMMIKYNSKIGF